MCKYFRFQRRHAKFGTARAHFGVGQCSILLGFLENLGIAAGIASHLAHSLSCKYFRFQRRHAKFGTARAYLVVRQCFSSLGDLENIGLATRSESLPRSQP